MEKFLDMKITAKHYFAIAFWVITIVGVVAQVYNS